MARSRIPVVTLILIVLNIAVAFAAVLIPDLVFRLGFVSSEPTVGRALACLFVHQNLFHLLANMLFLAAVGPAVEFATGAFRFLSLYAVGGIVGVLLHWAITASNPATAPLIGASGAVSSCAAFYSIRYAYLRVPVLPNISIPILAVFGIWILLQGVGAIVRIGDLTGGTAFWSHLGGFGSGAILALTFRAQKEGEVQFGHAVLDRMNQRSPAAAALAAKQHLQSHPQDARALRDLAESYRRLGDTEDEAAVLCQLAQTTDTKGLDFPIVRLAELGQLERISAIKRLRIAHDLETEHKNLATIVLSSIIKGSDSEPQIPDAILAMFELQDGNNPELSELLLNKYPLHPATEVARARGWIS